MSNFSATINSKSLLGALRPLSTKLRCRCEIPVSRDKSSWLLPRSCLQYRSRSPSSCSLTCSCVCMGASELNGPNGAEPAFDLGQVVLIHIEEVRHYWLHYRFAFVIRRHRNDTAEHLQ